MISRTRWLLRQLTRQLWFRATIFAAVGFVAAMAGVIAERYMGWEPPTRIATDTVERILDILASSMLAVTTFSLNVMVTAYGSATSNVTPRATKLLRQDSTTQNALGAFIGAFLFSLVGIIALGTGLYGDRGRLVLFAVTLAVVAFVITAMLRWIDHLSGLGRVGETARIVEETTRAALLDRAAAPTLGARACDPAYMTSSDHEPVTTRRIGYVQHVDLERLSAIAEDAGCAIHIEKPPGSFVFANDALARVHMDRGPAPDAETLGRMASAFVIEDQRSFDQDPRFGLSVLAEIASRALSPAVNDAGTAIDVVGRATRLLLEYANTRPEDDDVRFPRLRLAPLVAGDLLSDAFGPIARDGAAIIEVQLRLQKALGALARSGDGDMRAAALREARFALDHAEIALALDSDKQKLRDLNASIAAI
ncbi:MAG: DUF2254 domain-containing protein [Methylobacteriaceae bacterium]|nr:DUF2254 domain-containing protein [Methylobacteriaceae bacterium]MCO5086531.1 DUF2254 domain-containing protein [Methylobacteriaceae bacterium]